MIVSQLKTHSDSNWFPTILKTAQLYLRIIHLGASNNFSNAILTTSKKAYIVELTFNKKAKTLRIFLTLPAQDLTEPKQRAIFLRFQKSRDFETASVSFDAQSQSLLIEFQSQH